MFIRTEKDAEALSVRMLRHVIVGVTPYTSYQTSPHGRVPEHRIKLEFSCGGFGVLVFRLALPPGSEPHEAAEPTPYIVFVSSECVICSIRRFVALANNCAPSDAEAYLGVQQ